MFAQVDEEMGEGDSVPVKVETVAMPFWKLVGAIVVAQLIVGALGVLFVLFSLIPTYFVHPTQAPQQMSPPPPSGTAVQH